MPCLCTAACHAGFASRRPVAAEQMRPLFGCGLHPLAELRQQQLEGPDRL
jgi:hypothetical protein